MVAATFKRLFRRSARSAPARGRIRLVVNALHAKSGGGVTYLRNLLTPLADDGRFDIHLFLHASQAGLFHPVDGRVSVHLFHFPPGMAQLMLWEQFVLPFKARRVSADVVFSPANFGCLFIRDQVILLRNALAVVNAEPRLGKRVYWVVLGVLTLLSLIRVRRAAAVSHYAARALSLGFAGMFAGKIRVVHHGVDTGFRPAPGVPRQDFLLAVSDIYVQKNLHTLCRALEIVCRKYPRVRLKIAGQCTDAWYFESVRTLAAELGVADNMEFLGRLPATQLATLYQTCRAFVFPSTAETFGMPLVEAMACGAPVVSSSSTAMPEIVGDAALLFDPLDPGDMAQAILRVMEDEECRALLSQRGLARAAGFSWQRTAELTGDVLAEAAATRC
jgi:Glycosyltransferase